MNDRLIIAWVVVPVYIGMIIYFESFMVNALAFYGAWTLSINLAEWVKRE